MFLHYILMFEISILNFFSLILLFLFQLVFQKLLMRRVWRYQRGNQNAKIKKEQTTQWPKEKVQKNKQRSTKHTHKTKDRVTRTSLKTRGELRCSRRVSSSCSTMSLPLNIERDAIYALDNNILSITCIRVTQLVMESSAVDLRFELRSGQTKNYETGICCFSVNHASLTWWVKAKNCLLGLATYVHGDCSLNDLAL